MSMVAYTNRYEIKYLAEVRRLPEIQQEIGDFLIGDENGDEQGGYFNYSVYFDSPEYRFYSEKREGELVRIRPRIRLYRLATDSTPTGVFLELKGRYDRIITKRRVPISIGLAESLLTAGPAWVSDQDMRSSVMGEFRYLSDRFALVPCVTVLYHRTAFNAAFYPNLRITFDRMIQCSLATALDNPEHAFVDAIPPNWFIIELKYNVTIPRMLLERFHSLGLQQGTLSKFAMGLEQSFQYHRRPFVRG